MEIFEIKNLNFSYPLSDRKVLHNINFKVIQGEFITVIGKSGSGKTTLLRHLKPEIAPFGSVSGEILFYGENLNNLDKYKKASKIGFVFQNPDNQIVTDKVWHELAFGLESLGFDNNKIRIKVAEISSYFNINTWFNKDVCELSGGQKQLLNLASVMAMDPDVLILDEPTAQLDPLSATEFLNTLKKINYELGTTIILSEHRLEDLFPVSDKILVMDDGALFAFDSPEDICKTLIEKEHDLCHSLPTPARVFKELKQNRSCPLTVRDGRLFLNELFKDKEINYKEINECDSEIKNKSAVTLKEICFKYDKREDVLKNLSLSISTGAFHAILGANGSGKTTLMSVICGLLKPYRGKIIKENLKISMIPQNCYALFIKDTVIDDLKCVESNTDKVIETARSVDIENLLSLNPLDLSGGEIQRAALAKVLLTNPQILLLDEPTKGMDSYFKIKLANILKELNITIVMVSHDIEFCAKYADVCTLIFNGEAAVTAKANEFFSNNGFYTTAANRMARHIFNNAVTAEDVIKLCKKNITR